MASKSCPHPQFGFPNGADPPRRSASGHTLTPRRATREPNGCLWFGADRDREGSQAWFRTEEDAIRRMPDATPEGRGRRVLDALPRLVS